MLKCMRAVSGFDGPIAFFCYNKTVLSSEDVLTILAQNNAFMMKSVEYESRTNGHSERQIGVITAIARCAMRPDSLDFPCSNTRLTFM